MASSRGPQGGVTTASPLAGGLRKAYPRDGWRPLHGAWGLRAAPPPLAARPVRGGNRAPSEGVAQHCTQSRGEACKAWGLGRARAAAQGSTCPPAQVGAGRA